MNSINNLKSGQKALSMQMLVLAVVIILIALIGLFIQKTSISNINSGFKDYQRSTKLLNDINIVNANLNRIKGMVASSQDKQEIAKFSDQQTAIITEDINLVKKALETGISEEQKKFYQAIMDNLNEYQKNALQVIRTAPLGTGGAYLIAADEKKEAINQLLTQLIDFEKNIGEKGYSSSNMAFYVFSILLLILLVLCVVLIPSFIKKMMTSSVTEPLQETSGVLKEFANGKYSRSLSWDADDAIGELVQSVNSLRTKMNAAPAQKAPTPEVPPAEKTVTPETVAAPADEKGKSLSDMMKKSPEQSKDMDKLVTSSRKAIDKLQDI